LGPVAVNDDDGEPLILVSAAQYRRLKRREQAALRFEALSSSDLAAIARARLPEERAALDAQLGDHRCCCRGRSLAGRCSTQAAPQPSTAEIVAVRECWCPRRNAGTARQPLQQSLRSRDPPARRTIRLDATVAGTTQETTIRPRAPPDSTRGFAGTAKLDLHQCQDARYYPPPGSTVHSLHGRTVPGAVPARAGRAG
jgi:hypothetical protein